MPIPESPVSWEALQNRVSEVLGVPVASLDTRYIGICSEANRQAWLDITMLLMNKGYGLANVLAADQLKHWVIARGVVLALQMGATFSQYDAKMLELMDPMKRIQDLGLISINGVPTAPQPAESAVGGATFGQIAAVQLAERNFDRRRYW